MSGSRQVVDVISYFSGGCEAISDATAHEQSGDFTRNELNKHAVLARAIEVEIIPRLMLAHGQSRARRLARGLQQPRTIGTEEINEFARIAVRHDATVAEAFASALIEQGATVEHIFTELFAPAARYLGELWESDHYSFAEVTIGLSRIQQLVHEFSPFFEEEAESNPTTMSALLVPMPGDHHSLGVLLLEEFFRRAGWSVWTPQGVSEQQLISIVREERFDMVGISVTCEVPLDCIGQLIKSIRAASINREIMVMVGGRMFNGHPEYVAKVGADATDFDGNNAVKRVEALSSTRLRTR